MPEVIIAGGGPAGLAAAIAARRAGFDVSVYDSARPPIDKACGEGIMPDGLAALQRLHVTIPQSRVCPFRGIRFVEDFHTVGAEFPDGVGNAASKRRRKSSVINATQTWSWATGVTYICPQADQCTSTKSVHGAMR